MDLTSKQVQVYSFSYVKTVTSSQVVKKLTEANFGNSKWIISYWGTKFTDNEFKEYCKNVNIQHSLITTGVPKAIIDR